MEALNNPEIYGQSFSILCMELCIKDVHEATEDLLKKCQGLLSIQNINSSPSWKFPHISMDKVDILSVMQKYRSKNLPEDQRYQELLELLVDRICFSLTTTFLILTSGEYKLPVGDSYIQKFDKTQAQIGQGDSVDGHAHPNVAMLLKQTHEIVTSLIDSQQRSLGNEKYRGKKNESSKPNLTSTSAQTDNSISQGCETCLVAQNILKFLANTITHCLETFSLDPSEIANFRKGDYAWNLSQREYVSKWCQVLDKDCQVLKQKALQIQETNVSLQNTIEECKSKMEESQKNALLNAELQKKLQESQDEVEAGKKAKQEMIKNHQMQISKLKDTDAQLRKKTEACGYLEVKISNLNEALQKINSVHKKLHDAHVNAEKCKDAFKQQVEMLKVQNEELEGEGNKMKLELQEKNEEIAKLVKKLESTKQEELYKNEMKSLLEKAKKRLEACKKNEEEQKKAKIDDKSTIEKLKEEVGRLQEQVELLTLYPDLNGPINPPNEKDTENPLEAMKNQVKSNQLRIGVLQDQTDRLNTTLSRCSKLLM